MEMKKKIEILKSIKNGLLSFCMVIVWFTAILWLEEETSGSMFIYLLVAGLVYGGISLYLSGYEGKK